MLVTIANAHLIVGPSLLLAAVLQVRARACLGAVCVCMSCVCVCVHTCGAAGTCVSDEEGQIGCGARCSSVVG